MFLELYDRICRRVESYALRVSYHLDDDGFTKTGVEELDDVSVRQNCVLFPLRDDTWRNGQTQK